MSKIPLEILNDPNLRYLLSMIRTLQKEIGNLKSQRTQTIGTDRSI